jgi:thioredoxin reductase (NADPH)
MAEKIVIVGSGPAAWAAAQSAGQAGLLPLVFEGSCTEENRVRGTWPLGQLALADQVQNYPGLPPLDAEVWAHLSQSALPPDRFEELRPFYLREAGRRAVRGAELIAYLRQQAVQNGARVVAEEIIRVDFRRHPFLLHHAGGEATEALAVVVATGRRRDDPPWATQGEGFLHRGVSITAVSDGPLPRFRGRPVVVVGKGDAALEDASFLARFAARVHLVFRGRQLRPRWLAQARRTAILADPKIEIRPGREVLAVLGTEGEGVTAVRLGDTRGQVTEDLACSGVFLAADCTRPNTDFLQGQLELDRQGYVRQPRPHRTATSVAGVFAAGDVADGRYQLAITAAGTGCMAAIDAQDWLVSQGLVAQGD